MEPLSPFPPSFHGNPWNYGAALFAHILMSSLAVAQMLAIVSEGGRGREVARRTGMILFQSVNRSFWTPITLYRWQMMCFCMAILCTTFGDVLTLLFWGEAEADTMFFLFALDRQLDAAALLPFVTAVAIGAWSSQAIPQCLETCERVVKPPKWARLRKQIEIVSLILIIAIGVTLGKASL